MCGRLVCNFSPREICNSCCYKEPGASHYKTPQWKECYNSGKTFKPSYNVCPTDAAPVLLSGSHFQLPSRLVVPMLFGVIPQWTESGSSKYSTINCRIETILSSRLYKNLIEKKQRCAVICSGFYEWQKQSSKKKPYFIHGEQPKEIRADDPETWYLEFTPKNGSSGFRPLKLAALFEIAKSETLEGATLSFTIITKEAHEGMSWLHKRVPAVLESDEQLDAWLNCKEVDGKLALSYISPKANLLCFPASSSVNKMTNSDIYCIKKNKHLEENSGDKMSSANFLKNWLEKGQKRKSSQMVGESMVKSKKERSLN